MGPKLRRLRRDLGLTQQGMAADLGVSVSYVSLIESNQRPLTADTLLRLARTYRIDMADFAGDGGEESSARLQAVFKDPLFADIDLPALQTADVATNYPGIPVSRYPGIPVSRRRSCAFMRRIGKSSVRWPIDRWGQ